MLTVVKLILEKKNCSNSRAQSTLAGRAVVWGLVPVCNISNGGEFKKLKT